MLHAKIITEGRYFTELFKKLVAFLNARCTVGLCLYTPHKSYLTLSRKRSAHIQSKGGPNQSMEQWR